MGISVVIPVRFDEQPCARLLCELQEFRGPQFEILVVEAADSSLDPELHKSADRWLRSDVGRSVQLAVGAAEANQPCLWFLHADTRDVADAARYLIELFAQSPPVGTWGRFEVRFDDQRLLYRMVPWFMNWRSRLTGIATGDQGIYVSSALLLDAGGWPQQLLMEDVELCARLRRLMSPSLPPRGLVTLTTSARRWRTNGVWRTIFLMWRLRLKYALGVDPAELHKSYYVDNGLSSVEPEA